MPSQKAGQKSAPALHAQSRHRVQRKKKSRRSQRAAAQQLGSPGFAFVDISSLPLSLSRFTVAQHIEQEDPRFDLGDPHILLEILKAVTQVLVDIDPAWKDQLWEDDVSPETLVERSLAKLYRHLEGQLIDDFSFGTNKKGKLVCKFYQHYGDFYVKTPEIAYLTHIQKTNKALYEILLASWGHYCNSSHTMDWISSADMAINYMEERLNEDASQYAETPEAKRAEIKEDNEVRKGLKFWKEEVSDCYHEMQWLKDKGMEWLRKQVKTYPWKSYFEKRLLVWVSLVDRVVSRDTTWKHEHWEHGLHPAEYTFLVWSHEDTRVDMERNTWYHEEWNINEFSPLVVEVKDLKNVTRNTDLEDLERVMSYACRLFDQDFKVNLTAHKRLIRILK